MHKYGLKMNFVGNAYKNNKVAAPVDTSDCPTKKKGDKYVMAGDHEILKIHLVYLNLKWKLRLDVSKRFQQIQQLSATTRKTDLDLHGTKCTDPPKMKPAH